MPILTCSRILQSMVFKDIVRNTILITLILKKEGSGTTAFFPGCTLLAYASDLTRAAYSALQAQLGTIAFLEDCCGKVLYQFGLENVPGCLRRLYRSV